MILVTHYDIRRIKKDLYVVVANGDRQVADFSSFKEAEAFIFNRQSQELMGSRKPIQPKEYSKAA